MTTHFAIYGKALPATAETPTAENFHPKNVVEIDGILAGTRDRVVGVFDHHRTGEHVNLDTVPDNVDPDVLQADELATPQLDTDYLISAVVVRMGGKGKIDPPILRLLYAASEWCDYLQTHEQDQALKDKSLGLHLYLLNKGFAMRDKLCEEKNEMKNGRPNPSDETMTLIANTLGDELQAAIENKNLDSLIDLSYLSKKEAMQNRFKEATSRNDETLALMTLEKGERVDPLFAYELVKGSVLINAVKEGENNGRAIYNYTIGLNPKAYEKYDLRPMIEVMNTNDPNVLDQETAGIPQKDQKRWGGRSAAFGAPFGIFSGLSPERVAELIEKNLDKCKK